MQSAADKCTHKSNFCPEIDFFRRGSGRNPKMYSTTDKKDPEPTEYLIQINADYIQVLADITEQLRPNERFSDKVA